MINYECQGCKENIIILTFNKSVVENVCCLAYLINCENNNIFQKSFPSKSLFSSKWHWKYKYEIKVLGHERMFQADLAESQTIWVVLQPKEDVNNCLIFHWNWLVTRLSAQCDDSLSFSDKRREVWGRRDSCESCDGWPSTTNAKPRWRTNDPGGSRLSSVQLIGAGSQSITANIAQTLVY